ncbi:MAG: BatD family protein [Pseudomonadota bacterium]
MIRVIVLLGLGFFASIAVASDPTLRASVDRNIVAQGESFTLELIQRGSDEEPDLSPVLGDFDVLSTARSSQMNIVNGSVDSFTTWRYTLSPLRTGTLQIPAIRSGTVSSEPISIEVRLGGASSGDGQPQQDIFLEVNVDKQSPYVQEQVIMTVKIFRARNFYDGSLSEPHAENLMQQRLGEDSTYQIQRDGIRYTVIQRRYVMFPQKSGVMTIAPVVLSATVPAQSASQGSFGGLLAQRQPVRVRSEQIVLDVRAAPATFNGRWWLAASKLTLREQWSDAVDQSVIGEPINRTIVVQADGILRGQIPEVAIPDVPGLKTYADQPELTEESGLDGLSSVHKVRWAIIPSQPGRYMLPEIRLYWWNVKEDREAVAVLPAREISVMPTAAVESTPQVPFNSPTPSPAGNSSANSSSTRIEGTPFNEEADAFPWYAVVLALLIGWASTTIWLLNRLRRNDIKPDPRATGKSSTPKRGNLYRTIANAGAHGNMREMQQAILEWSETVAPAAPCQSLLKLAQSIDDPEVSGYLRQIDAAIYAGGTIPADRSQPLIAELKAFTEPRNTESQAGNNPLPQF